MSVREEPVIAQYKPYYTEVEQNKTYMWCACGRSANQPFCDNSHVDTPFKPVRYVAEATRAVLFCGCKHTGTPPFCDGTHNDLSDEYAEDERPRDELLAMTELVAPDERGIASLDGGCYVQKRDALRMETVGNLKIAPVIDCRRGARHLSQYYVEVGDDKPTPVSWPGADTLLYLLAGAGEITIGARILPVTTANGVYIRDGESFSLRSTGTEPIRGLLTVCPMGAELTLHDTMPPHFDTSAENRVGVRDPAKRNTMADRFYQVLVGRDNGSNAITQFIGEVPKSKAAPHRHLYEEAIVILSGDGIMWTEHKRTPVEPGDMIFLPAELEHSLECTSADGMALAGHFYPSGDPNINY